MIDDVKKYIDKQEPTKKEVINELRNLLKKNLPDITETMKWGVICYEDLYYIAALKDYVNIGFSILGLSKAEIKLFDGAGKTMRHKKIRSTKDVNKELVKLIKFVKKKCKPVHG